jgi:hypothetical protein
VNKKNFNYKAFDNDHFIYSLILRNKVCKGGIPDNIFSTGKYKPTYFKDLNSQALGGEFLYRFYDYRE